MMTLLVTKVKHGHHVKSSNDKGVLDCAETEETPAMDHDSTERVLAEVKSLKENYEQHYAEIQSRVKQSIEGPIKTFTMDDSIPIVMQLSVWDTKLGPFTAMLVGDADLMVSIPADELDASTRMIDVLAPGNTCDLSKDDLGRLMVKFSIVDPVVRGGEAWLLVVAYHDLAMDVPRGTIRELLSQTAVCWHDDVVLAEEAMGMRDNFDVGKSRWLMYLTEMRRSIWSIVQKSREVLPRRPIPDVDIPSIAEAIQIPESATIVESSVDPEPEQDAAPGNVPESKPEQQSSTNPLLEKANHTFTRATTATKNALGKAFKHKHGKVSAQVEASEEGTEIGTITTNTGRKNDDDIEPPSELVPIRLLPVRSAPAGDVTNVELSQPAKTLPKARPIEPAIVDVLGKLHRSGFSVKVNKETNEATAFRLVELEPGKGGLIALAYSFHAAFLAFPVIHVIDGQCYAGDNRATIDPSRPQASQIFLDHLPSSEEVLYRGKLFGRVHQDRPLRPVVIPIVLVQHAIKGADGDMPFCWIEPSGNGVHGYFIVISNEIDTLDNFIMNLLRVLGPRMADAETTHVVTMVRDIKQANFTGRGLAVLVIGAAIAGILASAQLLPLATTIAILQYWYVVATMIIGGLLAMGYVYRGLDKHVARAMGARAAAVAARTPFLVTPGWEDIVPAARRIGKALFPQFKAAFCQDLDTAAIDEATEVVFKQETPPAKPTTTKAFSDMADLATKTKMTSRDSSVETKATTMAPGLKVTDARTKHRDQHDDDILNDEIDGDDEPSGDAGTAVRIDPLEALRDK